MSEQAASAASEDGDSICETCHKIDLHDLLQNPRQARYRWEAVEPSPYTMRYSNGCKLCRLMFQGVSSHVMEKKLELRSFSFNKLSAWAIETNLDPNDSVLLRVGLRDSRSFLSYSNDDVFCKLAKDASQGSCCAQPVQGLWDCVKTRFWLDTCAKYHGSQCKQDLLQVPGMNLIDCEDMVVVKAAKEMRWLALSYVWGVSLIKEDDAGYRAGSKVSLDIPGTIKDAINVTRQLGYRYLWVDEYCIDQMDENHRNDQISRMDQIYRGADLTIVAAAGSNKAYGLPGVGSTRRKDRSVICVEDVFVFSNGPDPCDEAKRSEWFTRAWTFQEGFLSKRMLVFTEHQTSFYCLASSWMEGLGNPQPNAARQLDKNQYSIHLFESNLFVESPVWNWNHFADILEMYSQRQITKEADTLDAFWVS